MNREEALKLIESLVARPNVIADARRAFAQRYPDAPQEMIETATLHVCGDGIEAALNWLAAIEQFLQNPDGGLDYGAAWHLLYHLYNWQQFDALMPLGKVGIAEQLVDIRTFLAEGNPGAAKEVVERLAERLSGDLGHPGFA